METRDTLPCGECTITLEDVQLQLGLPVDGSVLTRSVQSADWGAIGYDFLGAISDNINGAGELSWGFVVLATLYREICRATKPNKSKIKGCISLLQSWARWNHSASYVGIPTTPEDIWLLLDQRSEAHQFRFRKLILVTPEVLDDEHKIDLRQSNTHWLVFFLEYIKIWENWYDYIPTRERIIVLELVYAPDYMPWFRIHGKPYLLSEEQRRLQIHVERER
ncbi:hypothetical protein PVK06_005848 [Gossypium arboreum]|uniref:Aminotransferase-like plant mobile domain-containing protein n=1 Tax=Gossypium arboreum TaxID=29729 RepID=A0ABR0QWZ6_GOSAR|nr:hypothetical protein PVK06_005848 [Gossypium arboreum]